MPRCTRWGPLPCWTALRYTTLVTLDTGTACGPAGEWWHGVCASVSVGWLHGRCKIPTATVPPRCHRRLAAAPPPHRTASAALATRWITSTLGRSPGAPWIFTNALRRWSGGMATPPPCRFCCIVCSVPSERLLCSVSSSLPDHFNPFFCPTRVPYPPPLHPFLKPSLPCPRPPTCSVSVLDCLPITSSHLFHFSPDNVPCFTPWSLFAPYSNTPLVQFRRALCSPAASPWLVHYHGDDQCTCLLPRLLLLLSAAPRSPSP